LPPPLSAEGPVTRDDFPYLLEIQTRWADNDVYGHVNNVVYYAYFDTIINRYLIDRGGLDIQVDHAIGVCVESQCSFKRSISFPETIHAGLRVTKVGTTSVRYEIGIFRGQDLCALGSFVHVFVERFTRKPTPIPPAIRDALERIAPKPGKRGAGK
jgi:acyl-CoA thioester hydrolase